MPVTIAAMPVTMGMARNSETVHPRWVERADSVGMERVIAESGTTIGGHHH